MNEHEKKTFLNAILHLAHSGENSMEMIQLSNTTSMKLCSPEVSVLMENDMCFKRNFADLVLVAISKNQQHVKAIAANSTTANRAAKPVFVSEQQDDVEP